MFLHIYIYTGRSLVMDGKCIMLVSHLVGYISKSNESTVSTVCAYQ